MICAADAAMLMACPFLRQYKKQRILVVSVLVSSHHKLLALLVLIITLQNRIFYSFNYYLFDIRILIT